MTFLLLLLLDVKMIKCIILNLILYLNLNVDVILKHELTEDQSFYHNIYKKEGLYR